MISIVVVMENNTWKSEIGGQGGSESNIKERERKEAIGEDLSKIPLFQENKLL